MSSRSLLRSFAAGEITPEAYGRLDLTKYQTGLALARNFRVLPHGPAQRRPGFKYVLQALSDVDNPFVRLIPFAYNAEQTAVLEFGSGYIRIFVDGQPLLSTIKSITVAGDLVTCTAHGYTVGQWVFIGDSPGFGRFYKVWTVPSVNSFTVRDLRSNVVTSIFPGNSIVAAVYQISSPYIDNAVLRDFTYAQNADVLTITHPLVQTHELRRLAATNWTIDPVGFDAPPAPTPAPTVVPTIATAGTASNQTYAFTYTTDDGSESLPSATTATSNPLNLAGNFNTISWSAVAGAVRYTVYKLRGGVLGYIGQSTTTSIVDDNITPDTDKVPPDNVYVLNDIDVNYPAAVTYHEQRRWFGGTPSNLQNLWATRSGTESNLSSSVPVQDDDALSFRIASQQQNAIRHLVSLSDLLVLTTGGEFRVFADNAPAITPTTLTVKAQGATGAGPQRPVVAASTVVYVQARGSHLMGLNYNWQQSAFASTDLSIMAPHLFDGKTIGDLAHVQSPVSEVWAVRSDGVLLCMTFIPEQQVYGWTQHHTDGAVESICVIKEGAEDVLYAVINRPVGLSSYRYVERLTTRVLVEQEDTFFVDSGLTYDGAPATTITGLWHLEGKTVDALADGAVVRGLTVTAGAVTLPSAASVVHLGLPYTSDMQTLPLVLEGAPAGGQGMMKNINSVRMRVTQSSAVKIGPSFDRLIENPVRDTEDNYDTPPALRTSEIRLAVSPAWGTDAAVCVRQDLPLPLTVLSMVLDVTTGG